MELFVVVVAILFVQVWGAENPFHKDAWLDRWVGIFSTHFNPSKPHLPWLVLGAIFIAASVLLWLVSWISYWLVLPLSVAMLLYSFGRGEFSEVINAYLDACKNDNWALAVEHAGVLDVDIQAVTPGNWVQLHQYVLEQSAYRGFERMFSVLFWFFVLGPAGALLYRVTFLYSAKQIENTDKAKQLLWLMEWPAVRVLGISFAFTGNFIGCYHRWKESLLCMARPTHLTLSASVLGALSVDDSLDQTCEVTRKELTLLDSLYRRTLWFWLAVWAVAIILL